MAIIKRVERDRLIQKFIKIKRAKKLRHKLSLRHDVPRANLRTDPKLPKERKDVNGKAVV